MLFLNICRRQLSALQTMEIPLDGAKYDWLLDLQTLILFQKKSPTQDFLKAALISAKS